MKKMISNLTMQKKLLLPPLTVIVFLVIFGIVSFIGMASQRATINDLYANRFKGYQTISTVINDIRDVHANTYKVLSWSSADFLKQNVEKLAKNVITTIDATGSVMDKARTSGKLSEMQKKHYTTSLAALKGYKDSVEKVIDMSSSDFSLATTLMFQADKRFQELNKALNDLLALEDKLSRESYDASLKTYSRVIIIFVAVIFIAIAASLLVSITLTRFVLAPIKRTVEVIGEISRGDLTRRIDIESKDEIGGMAVEFNTFVENLHGTVMKVAESSNKVASAADTLDSNSGQMASGVEQAAGQINNVATASEEMSTTSMEIAQNCAKAAKSSEKANGSAVSGETITRQTAEVMDRINMRVKESALIIKKLGERSDQIGAIVELINEIADQTNLLALNAAIEAARAGEHGRGFAVVADEVKKLAERTTDATQEIEKTIQSMQTETKSAVSSMEQGVREVEVGTSETSKSGSALKDILEQISIVAAEVNQIAVASEQQTATTNEITGNIHQISMAMQDTAKNIQGSAMAASQMANLSKELQGIVNQFKL
ncbi:MAG: methyl-accepting chemotaxis protein [Syntrophorhabdaceae bacterium]|nr:methyl-accepting chemotaxis protein [Syntrophorhabdaceae bacterium]